MQKAEDGPDYEKLIARERTKLRRVQEAYENEVYTLQEFAERKRKISAEIERLQAEAAASCRAQLRPEAMREKVLDVLRVVKDPDQPEMAKNAALRTVISYIVYNKPAQALEVYFYT